MATKRTDIQGLRALAVLIVVIYHVWPERLSGGFIGVDVFFVISGYLITAHLLGEVVRTGRISLRDFWARRVRRLLPAAFTVLIVAVALSLLILPESILKQNLAEIGAAAVYALNWLLVANSVDYLASENAPSVVQHFWSLSVEEQFYILWPLVLVGALFISRKNGALNFRQHATVFLAVIFVSSLGISIWVTHVSPNVAYFATYTRAWEFASGGLLAMYGKPIFDSLSSRMKDILSWCGLGLVLVPAFLYTSATPFPGWTAAVPVLGTLLLLKLGDCSSIWSPQFLAKFAVVQVVGDVSYAMYLWHWPMVVAVPVALGHPIGLKSGLAIVVGSFVLALVTQRFVEEPFRKRNGPLRGNARTYTFMAAGMVCTVAVVFSFSAFIRTDTEKIDELASDPGGCFGYFAIANDCAEPYAVTDTVSPIAAVDDQSAAEVVREEWDCLAGELMAGRECELVFGSGSGPRIALVGDSHADHLLPAIMRIAEEDEWTLDVYTKSSCSAFEGARELSPKSVQEQHDACVLWGEDVRQELIEKSDVDLVLLSSNERANRIDENRVSAGLDELELKSLPLAVITDVPGLPAEQKGPNCVETQTGRGIVDDPCSFKLEDSEGAVSSMAEARGIPTIDLRSELAHGGVTHSVIGGTIVYHDRAHLTGTFARTLAPWLSDQIDSILDAE